MSTEKILHRLLNHQMDAKTEIINLGTFNPETPKNEADFFYGRSRNYLWRLLPAVFGEESLKKGEKTAKLEFISRHHIDFIDLIETVVVDAGHGNNYADAYLDRSRIQFRKLKAEFDRLKHLKKVYFTRNSFRDIPNMSREIEQIKVYCEARKIAFVCLPTPARFYNEAKQENWNQLFQQD